MSADAVVLSDINYADWSLKLDAIGEVVQGVDDVNQCIAIILTTPLGSDPLRPTFGADLWQYIDNPIDSALPAIVRELTQAIGQWEPRVKVLSISAAPLLDGSVQSGAHLSVAVSWSLSLGGTPSSPQTTQVTIP
ncbi:MAG TPA: GPW/gp25 family protein [Candidatus Binataceae bacterium]